jgi:hypothetical protein
MECSHHVKPLAVKVGELVFKCPCWLGFTFYVCSHTVLLSAKWGSRLRVRSSESLNEIKDRQCKAKAAIIPFNYCEKKNEKAIQTSSKWLRHTHKAVYFFLISLAECVFPVTVCVPQFAHCTKCRVFALACAVAGVVVSWTRCASGDLTDGAQELPRASGARAAAFCGCVLLERAAPCSYLCWPLD